jgi:hypothetical protein
MSVVINGSAGVTTNSGAVYNGIASGTAVASTSGTSIDFTSIPSWVKRITVMLNGISTNSTSNLILQLGDSGGIETSSYTGSGGYITAGGSNATLNSTTTGFLLSGQTNAAAYSYTGIYTLSLIDSATNTWVFAGQSSTSDTTARVFYGSGAKATSAALDRIRLTTANGTDTFDAGSINIMYEG